MSEIDTQSIMTGPVDVQGDSFASKYRQYPDGRMSTLLEDITDNILEAMLSERPGKSLEYMDYSWRLSQYNGKNYVWRQTVAEHKAWLAAHGYSKGGSGNQQQKTIQSLQPSPRNMPPAQLTKPRTMGIFQEMTCIQVEAEGGMQSVNKLLVEGYVYVGAETVGERLIFIMGLP